MGTIAKPFGWLLMWLYEFTMNYGIAVILFGIIVKLILLPFQVKSKKSMMRTQRLQPQINELQKKYSDDQQTLNMEIQKLYRENRINPMSGCIWSLIPFPILIALYQAIRFPLTIMMGVPANLLEEGGAIAVKLNEMGFAPTLSAAYVQIEQSQFITSHFSEFASLSDKLHQIDFTFLGLDLGAQPHWNFFMNTNWSDPAVWGQALALFMMPVLAAIITWLSSKMASASNPNSKNPDDPTAGTMKTMNLMMPIMTLVFGFMMPAALCLYWIVSMGLGVIQDWILNKQLRKKLASEEAEYNARMAEKEAKLEAKRQQTERLRAENATVQNKSTSKAKVQKLQKDAQKAKAEEWERQHSPQEEESKNVNPSKVGDRPYARGRNYDPDRYNY